MKNRNIAKLINSAILRLCFLVGGWLRSGFTKAKQIEAMIPFEGTSVCLFLHDDDMKITNIQKLKIIKIAKRFQLKLVIIFDSFANGKIGLIAIINKQKVSAYASKIQGSRIFVENPHGYCSSEIMRI